MPLPDLSDDRPIVVFGNSPFAAMTAYCLSEDARMTIAAHTVDGRYRADNQFENKPLVAFEDLEAHFHPDDCRLVFAVGYHRINSLRMERAASAQARGYSLASYLSSRASAWPNVEIGAGALIFEHAILQPFSRVGALAIIRSGVHVSHHCSIEDGAFLAAEVAMGGGCTIGRQAFLGVGAVLRDNLTLGARSIVGAGAVAITDTEPDAVYVGNPARKLNKTAMEATGG